MLSFSEGRKIRFVTRGMYSVRMYRPITEPRAPAATMPQGFGFHFTMMNARMVQAGGANTGIVSTSRAAANAARYSTAGRFHPFSLARAEPSQKIGGTQSSPGMDEPGRRSWVPEERWRTGKEPDRDDAVEHHAAERGARHERPDRIAPEMMRDVPHRVNQPAGTNPSVRP